MEEPAYPTPVSSGLLDKARATPSADKPSNEAGEPGNMLGESALPAAAAAAALSRSSSELARPRVNGRADAVKVDVGFTGAPIVLAAPLPLPLLLLLPFCPSSLDRPVGGLLPLPPGCGLPLPAGWSTPPLAPTLATHANANNRTNAAAHQLCSRAIAPSLPPAAPLPAEPLPAPAALAVVEAAAAAAAELEPA